MGTAEPSTTHGNSDQGNAPKDTSRRRSPLPLLLVMGAGTALVVGVTLSLYSPASPEQSAPQQLSHPVASGPAPAQAPLLTTLPPGVAVPGCLDPHSHDDTLLLCAGDVSSGWVYDAGLAQHGPTTPTCANAALGSPSAWTDMNNGLTHVHETVFRDSASRAHLAEITSDAVGHGAALCSNLPEMFAAKVTPLSLSKPPDGAAVSAWAVPAAGRTWDLVLIAVPGGLVRLDVIEIGSASAIPSSIPDQLMQAASARYLAG